MMSKKCDICTGEMNVINESTKYIYYYCKRCHFYSTMKKEETFFDYDDYETFDSEQEKREDMLLQAQKMLNYKFSMICNSRVPESFLDIGCSEGVFVEAYNRIVGSNKGYGIEVSESKIKRGKERGLNIYSYNNMPELQFDFVLLRHVIEHIDTPIDYLREIIRYVNKGGVICIETPHNENFYNTINGNQIRDDRFLRDLYPPTHVCGFTPRAISLGGEKVGLTLLKMITHDARNSNWYYTNHESIFPWTGKLLEKMHLGTNVVAFFMK